MQIPRNLSEFDIELLNRVKLLSEALTDVLRKDGVLNNDTRPSGEELLVASEEYCSHAPSGQ